LAKEKETYSFRLKRKLSYFLGGKKETFRLSLAAGVDYPWEESPFVGISLDVGIPLHPQGRYPPQGKLPCCRLEAKCSVYWHLLYFCWCVTIEKLWASYYWSM